MIAALLGGAFVSAGVCNANELTGHEHLPMLPPAKPSARLIGYHNPDGLGLSDAGMLESGAVATPTPATEPELPHPTVDASAAEILPPPSNDLVSDGLVADELALDGVSSDRFQIPAPPDTQTTLPQPTSIGQGQPMLIDYETALAMVGGRHPVVGFAQARVREAYAELTQAKAMWLPTIRAGVTYHRHDGNLQASGGAINDVDRSSLQAGLGAGAVGAGTTPRPGVVAEFKLSDAIFRPRVAQRTVWARQHAQTAAFQTQLQDVAIAYNSLLLAYQEIQVIQQSRERTNELAELTASYAEAGEGLQADADRMKTELNLIRSRLLEATEQQATAQNRLIEALSLDCVAEVQPADIQLTPIYIVDASIGRGELISVGLAHRPELKQLQCFVAATVEEYKRQKYAPFLPSVLMGVSQTGFGGGLGSTVNNVDSRTDLDLMAVWEVRNLGFGERAARSRAAAASHQAKYRQLQQMDRVAREVADGQTQIIHRGQQVTILQTAIDAATDSYQRNVSRIKDGEGLPLEVLQSIQALENAQLSYARAVARHNEAQFRLQWALGWPIHSVSTY
tara:strand:+ start:613634 stop:615331 length:1698 start_codon:yes stop_codon:yes gene_type:complete